MCQDEAGCSSDGKTCMLTLRSSDDHVFEVEEGVAFLSTFIKDMVEDTGTSNAVIPLSNVNSKVLAKVLEYCNFMYASKHSDPPTPPESVKAYEDEFVKLDQIPLFELILASNYLNIQSLLDLACQAIANKIKDTLMMKDGIENVRQMFGIKNDFTPEEEEEVRKDNAWAFE